MPTTSSYDKFPSVAVPQSEGAAVQGWPAIEARLRRCIAGRGGARTLLVVDCYPGVDTELVRRELAARLDAVLSLSAEEAMRPVAEVESLTAAFAGEGDPVFGFLSDLTLPQFFDAERLGELRRLIAGVTQGLVLVVGHGAALLAEADILVYADMARWEAQKRFRRNQVGNVGLRNAQASAGELYKRAYFIDWRVADRWKLPLIKRCDLFLDTHNPAEPKLVEGEAVRRGLRHAVSRPFRVVPFFDPAPWGGQWMRTVCGLDEAAPNFGWCFDCVPEENSLLLQFGDIRVEMPSLNLVLAHPRELLGEAIQTRFGDEFPIRFDFLDTMGGGNLSFQVHPLTEYIRRNFGLSYTQDESYYLLDAGPGASVYLGLKEDTAREEFARALEAAQAGGPPFPAERFANRWPAKKHDHFLIPAGTVHCSGANAMVLEISATPYIFTFKMWDWGRLGLDGKPRPIHLKHGLANVQWDRTTAWVERNLVNRVEPAQCGPGWREERTGLHELEFIETRRHWFSEAVPHHTQGTVNVLNLVEGEEVVVESPEQAFSPFVAHYAETFIVPARVGPYTVRPTGRTRNATCATMKAFVRPARA